MKVIYEQDLGMETYAEVRLTPSKKYVVFVAPMFGGDFFQYTQDEFDTLEEAKKFVNSIT
jgi:hypothetical protein